jgi:hypothetical protein
VAGFPAPAEQTTLEQLVLLAETHRVEVLQIADNTPLHFVDVMASGF